MAEGGDHLEAAFSIGAQICRDAIWWEDQCNWLGDHPRHQAGGRSKMVTGNLGADLYGGTSGMALFLARLFEHTREAWFSECARGAARHAARSVPTEKESAIGFFNGSVGRAYCLLESGRLLGDQELVAAGTGILRKISQSPEAAVEDEVFDVIGGGAGAVLALTDLQGRFSLGYPDEVCGRLGRRLVASAVRSERGCCWVPERRSGEPGLTGMAHGAAGVTAALARLDGCANDEAMRGAIEAGLDYEQSWYQTETGNWPDLRHFAGEETGDRKPPVMSAWCHGAPGIGLARLEVATRVNSIRARKEAAIALETTARGIQAQLDKGTGNYSLCHGLAGNADILLSASAILKRPDFRALAQRVGAAGWKRFGDHRPAWPNGLNGRGYTPNLMMGIAGTGYFYLRLHEPSQVPTILLPGLG